MEDQGIYIPDPPPPDISTMSDDDLRKLSGQSAAPHPDMSHISDEQLMHMAKSAHPDMSHISDEDLMKMAGQKPEPSATPDEIGKAFTKPINEFVGAPVAGIEQLGQYGKNLMNRAMGRPEEPANDQTLPVQAWMKKNLYPDVPDTTGTRIAGAAGNSLKDVGELMGTMGTEAGPMLYNEAAPIMQKASEGMGPVTRALQDTYRSYAAKPSLLTRDVFFGAPAAGAGQQIAHEDTEGSPAQPLADMAGAIAGNTAGTAGHMLTQPMELAKTYWKYGLAPNAIKAVGLPTAARELYTSALDHIPDSMTEGDGAISSYLRNMKSANASRVDNAALPIAANTMQDILRTPSAQQNYGIAQGLRDKIAGFNPTLAESTGAPSLLSTQKSMEGKATGSILDNFVQRKLASQGAITDFANKNAPADSGADIAGAAQRRLQQAAGPVDNQLDSVQRGREAVADTLPDAQAHQVGASMRDQLEQMRSAKMADMSKLSDDMGLNDAKNLRVSRDSLQKAVQSALPSRFAVNTSPTLKTISKLDEGDALSFKDAQYFQSNLKSEARQAAKNGNNWDAKILTDASGNISKYLSDEWAPALGIGDKYKAFNDRYLNEYVKPFEQGTAKDVSALGGDTRYRTDNEDVASKFWQPGNVTAAQDFHKTFQGNPQAETAMQAHILDDLRGAAVKDGVIDPAKMDKWMAANKDNLQQFPTIQKDLADKGTMARDLAERQATLEDRKQMIEDSDLSQMLQKKNVTVDGLLQDKNTFGRVVQNATPAEKQALARQMWNRATEGGEGGESDPAAMKQFLTDNADTLPQVLGRDHIQNLHDLADAWEMNARTSVPSGAAVDQNPFAAFTSKVGSTPQQLLSRAFAVKSGRTGIKYTAGDMLARLGLNANKRQADEMISRSIYDPEFADTLTNYVKSDKVKPENLKRIKAYMFNSGISAMTDDGEENQDDTH